QWYVPYAISLFTAPKTARLGAMSSTATLVRRSPWSSASRCATRPPRSCPARAKRSKPSSSISATWSAAIVRFEYSTWPSVPDDCASGQGVCSGHRELRRLEMAVQAESTPEQRDRWSPELIDLSRPLTVETVDALFGDLVADGKNAYFRDISIDVVVDFSTAN